MRHRHTSSSRAVIATLVLIGSGCGSTTNEDTSADITSTADLDIGDVTVPADADWTSSDVDAPSPPDGQESDGAATLDTDASTGPLDDIVPLDDTEPVDPPEDVVIHDTAQTADAGPDDAGAEDVGSATPEAGPAEDAGPVITEGPAPLPGELVISEIMFDPVGFSDANAEWLEVINTSDHDVSLAHCQLHDMGSDMADLAAAGGVTLVPAGAHWLLASSPDPVLNGGVVPDLNYSNLFLANTSDEIALTCAGLLVDSVAYDKATWPMSPGRALSLSGEFAPDALGNDQADSWCRSPTLYGIGNFGTPGEPNPVCLEPDGSVDLCQLLTPDTAVLLVGTSFTAAAVVYDEDTTDINSWVDAHPDLVAEVGLGPVAADAAAESDLFAWTNALGATGWSDEAFPGWDRYEVVLSAPEPGAYQVVARFSLDSGETWMVCDLSGSEDGYAPADAGQLTTGLDPCDPNPCSEAPAPECSGDGLEVISSLAPGTCGLEGLSAICDFETETSSCSLLGGTCDSGGCVDIAPAPIGGELILTEIMPNPAAGISDNHGEWFELVVLGSETLNLEGCTLSSGANDSHLIHHDGAFLVYPGEVLLFTRSADTELNGGLSGGYTYAGLSLGNIADSLALHCNGALIDSVVWSTEDEFPLEPGLALQLSTDAYDSALNDESSAWCAASTAYAPDNTGTPGLPNPPCPVADPCEGVNCDQAPPDTCILGVATSYVPTGQCADGICAYVEASTEDCAAAGVLCAAGACGTSPDPCLPNPCIASTPAACEGDTANALAAVGTCSIDLPTGDALCDYPPVEIDCASLGGVCLDGGCSNLDTAPIEGSVVFNELLVSPTQSAPDQGTWLELVNTSANWVDLSGCILASDGAGTSALSPDAPVWLAPGEPALFATSPTPQLNGGFTPDVLLSPSFSLPPGGSTLTLTCGDTVIDTVTYEATDWGSTAGAAWQLDPESMDATANDLASAWCWAAVAYGKGDLGSPGAPNPPCPAINAVDWCRIEAPQLAEVIVLGDQVVANGAFRELPLTSLSPGTDPHPAVHAQLIAGPPGGDPAQSIADWVAIDCAPSLAWAGEGEQIDVDKYTATWTPTVAGEVALSIRVTVDQGRSWTYCDRDTGVDGEDGSEDGYSPQNAIALVVAPSPCEPNPCATPPEPSCDGDTSSHYEPLGACTTQGLAALCDYAPSTLDCSLYEASCADGSCVGMPTPPAPGDVVITEIMTAPDSSTDDGGEWFELLNVALGAVVLDGCVLSDPSLTDSHTIDPPTPLVLQPGELVVFGRTANPAANGGAPVDYFYGQTFTLDDESDGVILTCAGSVIDSVAYGPLFPTVIGASMQLSPEAQDAESNDGPEPWCPSYTPFGAGDQGTPGAANLPCPTPTAVGWCRLQAPESILEAAGAAVTVYGHVYQLGVTDISSGVDSNPLLIGQLAYGPDETDPVLDDSGWTFISAEANAAWSDALEPNNDEYLAVLTTPAPGTYDYAFRFSADGGLTWTWCDLAQGLPESDGSADGYQVAASGDLYVSEGPCDPNPCSSNIAPFCDGDQLITELAPGACTALDATYECDYTPQQTDCAAAGGQCLEAACVDTGVAPVPGDIIFTEIMSNPDTVSDAIGEWLELNNVSGHKLDLAGCRLDSETSSAALPAPHYIVEQGAFFVMTRSADVALNGGVASDATFSFSLKNSSQFLAFECGDLQIDSMSYNEDYPGSQGVAMQLDPESSTAEGNDQPYNWCAATSSASSVGSDLGSPGAPNADCPYVDPCLFMTCDAPPEASCEGDVLWTPTGEDTCTDGLCGYPAVALDCAEAGHTCDAGACTPVTNAVDWCRLQWPLSVEAYPGETTLIYGRYFEAGLTDATAGVDESDAVEAVIAFGPDGSDPTLDDSEWSLAFPADANPGWDDVEPGVDEVWAEVPTPPTGEYDYAMRITVDGGASWTWCDTAPSTDSNGSEDGYQAAHAGQWHSLIDPCDATPCHEPPDNTCTGDVLYTYSESGSCSLNDGVPECSYLETVLDCSSDGQACEQAACIDIESLPFADAMQLTEMMLDPTMASAEAGTWLEYTNLSDVVLNLQGCVVQAGEISAPLAGLTSSVAPGQPLVIGTDADPLFNGGYTADIVLSELVLSTDTHTITLTCAEQVIDTVTFDPALWAFSPGASLQLGAEHDDNTLASQWCSSSAPYGDGDLGSPGTANEACAP